VFGEIDPITGVSANIMTGQPIRGGTSFSQILLDEDAVINLQKEMEELAPMDQEQDVPDKQQGEDDMCSPSRLRMNITLPTATQTLDEDDVELVVLE
jgi:hypothetical protein